MPFELGLFLDYPNSRAQLHHQKRALILDSETYRYQKYLSDIVGHDIKAHENKPERLIAAIRASLTT